MCAYTVKLTALFTYFPTFSSIHKQRLRRQRQQRRRAAAAWMRSAMRAQAFPQVYPVTYAPRGAWFVAFGACRRPAHAANLQSIRLSRHADAYSRASLAIDAAVTLPPRLRHLRNNSRGRVDDTAPCFAPSNYAVFLFFSCLDCLHSSDCTFRTLPRPFSRSLWCRHVPARAVSNTECRLTRLTQKWM